MNRRCRPRSGDTDRRGDPHRPAPHLSSRRRPRSTACAAGSRATAAKRAGLPLAKLLGAHRDSVRCYDTTGGFLHEPIERVLSNAAAALSAGVGGIKLKVGHPSPDVDLARVRKVRSFLGAEVPLMVDANQQWDRATALRMGRRLEELDVMWIEEPLDAYDVPGHAELAASLDTPVATGEMLTSVAEHVALIEHRAADVIQPDAPRIGGITQFLRLATLAEHRNLTLAPHFAMELHVHLAAAYPHEPWVEHFDWLHPLFTSVPRFATAASWCPGARGWG